MRYLIVIFPLFVLLSSCHPRVQETETISERGPDSIYAAYLVLARSLPDSLGKIGPYVVTQKDSGTSYEVLDSPYLAIGKLIDSTGVFALSCRNYATDSSVLKLYKRKGDQWKLISTHVNDFYVRTIEYLNANSSLGTNEILLTGTYNMNGNCNQLFFNYDPGSEVLGVAGGFFSSDFRIDAAHDLMQVEYHGSWYMDIYKELILWRRDSMVTLRRAEIIISPKEMTMPRYDTLQYLVNTDTTYSADLKTIFSERDNEKNPHHKKYWDGFFDLK